MENQHDLPLMKITTTKTKQYYKASGFRLTVLG